MHAVLTLQFAVRGSYLKTTKCGCQASAQLSATTTRDYLRLAPVGTSAALETTELWPRRLINQRIDDAKRLCRRWAT